MADVVTSDKVEEARLDKRLTRIELTLSTLVGILTAMQAGQAEILRLVSGEQGPSETAQVLQQIVQAQEQIVESLHTLPSRVAAVVREEIEELYREPEEEPADHSSFGEARDGPHVV